MQQHSHSTANLDARNSYTVKEAAELAGVSSDTIKRRIQDDRLPGALQIKGQWRIPFADLGQLAKAEGWTLDLTEPKSADDDELGAPAWKDLVERVLEEAPARARAEAELKHANSTIESLNAKVKQLTSDLEESRMLLDQQEIELSASAEATNQAKAKAAKAFEDLRAAQDAHKAAQADSETAIANLEGELTQTKEQHDQTVGERDQLVADLTSTKEQHVAAVGERDQLAADNETLQASLGWWSRRKYERASGTKED